ncbi:DUF3426 domain-containing protein [Propionivibrio sp.]|uniref:DUF3426 domain-containing protein n=1 Tax=Propionivibrio sp. TaxID=2212460 RepID=UPI0025FC08F9|nr:DUF3426 domain-containing protein [Propionivibrio sp.]MBK7355070.1 DUF3426 domain-containing protein [Propionivibrio sp.]MBK8402440.1 DUF3426 domain-containing protein [Propionivibrio sp.]MBK8743594.1 DUF3426 domain-containing protein [Propionivibrio sp.]MBK8892898.1 DUF3426 domain-containing protein [Propionivibrio sp.]MBL0206439.1 DUF3426 domain-containing protein [Propionivibrio sp.]
MRTCCPACRTNFRVTPDQLKVRAGKVRCGQCQAVFNALDGLLDESIAYADRIRQAGLVETSAPKPVEPAPASDIQQDASPAIHAEPMATPVITAAMPPGEEVILLSEKATQDLGKATGLILPRETTEIPGYSKWTEGAMFGPETTPVEKAARWPFVLASLLLILALCGQLIFRFRSEIAMTSPGLRPMLEEFSKVFNASLPLPRHVELVSIETSDLQTDPAHGNLLVLNATLRNRASYEQDYPALELSLTDTQDAAIARRVFMPGEYLPSKLPVDQPFVANTDVAVRLWIEAKDISAAGYRLYVFYP